MGERNACRRRPAHTEEMGVGETTRGASEAACSSESSRPREPLAGLGHLILGPFQILSNVSSQSVRPHFTWSLSSTHPPPFVC